MSVKLKRRTKPIAAEMTREQKMVQELIAACRDADDKTLALVQALDARRVHYKRCYYEGLLPPHEAVIKSHLGEFMRGNLRHHGLYQHCNTLHPGGVDISFEHSVKALLEHAGQWDAKAEEIVGGDFDEDDGVIA